MQLQPVRNEIIVPTININDRKEEAHEVVNKQKRWKRNPFIEANTREVEMAHLRK